MNTFDALTSSNTNEWYTPSDLVEKARLIMGTIDLDPASCHTANQVVKATQYFNIMMDGLNQPWHGNVFLNPPYGKESGAFITRLLQHFDAGDVTQAMVIIRGDGKELRQLTERFLFAVPNRRVNFLKPDLTASRAGVPGTKIFGVGVDEARFVDVMKQDNFAQVFKSLWIEN